MCSMYEIIKNLIIGKKMEAVTADFVENNQKYTNCTVATLEI